MFTRGLKTAERDKAENALWYLDNIQKSLEGHVEAMRRFEKAHPEVAGADFEELVTGAQELSADVEDIVKTLSAVD